MSHLVPFKASERFSRYFHVAPALDEASRNEVYFIRHDVYARELGFEKLRADQRETDRYDSHSVHCIVRTADAARRPVGCVRLVIPDAGDPHAPLPFESLCHGVLDRSILDPAKCPRDRIAEVSRLAIMGEFRRRKGEQQQPLAINPEDCGGAPVVRFPNIPISLYFAAVAMAQRQGIEYLFTLTEPRLARHFALSGVDIRPIGKAVEHRGQRVPSVMRVSEIYPRLRSFMRPIWHEVHAQMDSAFMVNDALEQAASRRPVSGWPSWAHHQRAPLTP